MIFLLTTGSAFLRTSKPGLTGPLGLREAGAPGLCLPLPVRCFPGHPCVSGGEAGTTWKELGTSLVEKSLQTRRPEGFHVWGGRVRQDMRKDAETGAGKVHAGTEPAWLERPVLSDRRGKGPAKGVPGTPRGEDHSCNSWDHKSGLLPTEGGGGCCEGQQRKRHRGHRNNHCVHSAGACVQREVRFYAESQRVSPRAGRRVSPEQPRVDPHCQGVRPSWLLP